MRDAWLGGDVALRLWRKASESVKVLAESGWNQRTKWSVLLPSVVKKWGHICLLRGMMAFARAEDRDKWETNDGTLIVSQQSGDGDMFGGKGLRDEWETPISSLKREKGRRKKGKCASKSYPADFSED
ncbi:hypothetical protein Ancab_036701 [Ancistrocladus abbreviatus]